MRVAKRNQIDVEGYHPTRVGKILDTYTHAPLSLCLLVVSGVSHRIVVTPPTRLAGDDYEPTPRIALV